MVINLNLYFQLVILDAPTGMNSDAWSLIADKIAKLTRVSLSSQTTNFGLFLSGRV